ncbi:hypothetical protein Patl1_04123 [Pistacia atlantica]|uniref:Uncharacterized protein n=1 Tax=Pistacia atlantica TaxID=434234 RepID=A0ACC1BTJ0_9ROSI|nr:hypothetical protein Patl1_04123 [Pistacia atlantica]
MELCITTSSKKFLPVGRAYGSVFVPLKNSTLHFKNQKTSLTSLKFSSFSRQIQPQFHRNSCRVSALAGSSVALGTEMDKLPADIQVTETEEPNSRVRLNVEVPPAVCEDCYKRVMREFMKQAKIPGFRPGKNVPESILLSYVGKQNVQKATVESILKRTLPHAMSSVTGRALRDSVRIATKFSEMEKNYSSLNSLRFEISTS